MGDGLPELICLECLNRLNNAFEFRKQCKISDKTLNELKASVKLEDNKLNNDNNIENKEVNIDCKSEKSYSNNDSDLNNFDEDSENELLVNRINQENKSLQNLTNNKINPLKLQKDLDESNSNREVLKNGRRKRLKLIKKTISKRKIRNNVQDGIPCPKCNHSFELESDLEIHMITHQVLHELKCPKCLKSFDNIKNLKRHLNIHMTNKPYKCNICNKCFAAPGARSRHLRVHTGI